MVSPGSKRGVSPVNQSPSPSSYTSALSENSVDDGDDAFTEKQKDWVKTIPMQTRALRLSSEFSSDVRDSRVATPVNCIEKIVSVSIKRM